MLERAEWGGAGSGTIVEAPDPSRRRRIAIIGAGITGLTAAAALTDAPETEIILYERTTRPGGHAATVDVDHHGRTLPVDTGFIVYNEPNYPRLTALLAALGVETLPAEMSLSVSLDAGRFEWAGHTHSLAGVANGVFAQRFNAMRPRFWLMLADIVRFGRSAAADLRAGRLARLTLGEYLHAGRFSDAFRDGYILPMGCAIWSTQPAHALDFPAASFVAFMEHHGLLGRTRPQWRTIKGGSRQYVDRLAGRLRGSLRLATEVVAIERRSLERGGLRVLDRTGAGEQVDAVILATHAPDALRLLQQPTENERRVLGAFRVRQNEVYLHADPSQMPRRRGAWSAWNVIGSAGTISDDTTVTYWMNRLQGIDPGCPLFVTLNPSVPPAEATIFGRYDYAHPVFDRPAVDARRALDTLQGRDGVWFCGAWTGNGFHEDGLSSGLAAALALGGHVPWRETASQQDADDHLQGADSVQ